MPSATSKKLNIVIAGGGFGGISAALRLDKALRRFPATLRERYRIVLVNNHHSHLYTPALYEIAAIPQGEHALQYVKSSIAIPLANIFHGTNVEWLERTIVTIDRKSRKLLFYNEESLSYEFLVVALGAQTAYFNIPGAEEHSLPLKTFADAIRLRDKIQLALEDEDNNLAVVICGGGATGVELAAEFENFVCAIRNIYHPGRQCIVRVTIIEAGPQILPSFSPDVVTKTRRRLEQLGVAIKTGNPVSRVERDKIILKDETSVPYSVFVWAGGVKANSILETLELPLSKKGGLPVNEYLEADERIYAIGDNAYFVNPKTGEPLPWNAPIAENEARIAVENIIANILGREKKIFQSWKKYPFILALGNKYAVADLVLFTVSGVTAWALKLAVELRYLFFILPFWEACSTWWKYVSVSLSNDSRATTPTEEHASS